MTVERPTALHLQLELSADPLVLARIVTLCGTRRYEIVALDYGQGEDRARLELAVDTPPRRSDQVAPHLRRLLGVLEVRSAQPACASARASLNSGTMAPVA